MPIDARSHGPHECQCVSCGYTTIVDAYIKCNTLMCLGCGERMRSSQTGEYRGTEKGMSRGISRKRE